MATKTLTPAQAQLVRAQRAQQARAARPTGNLRASPVRTGRPKLDGRVEPLYDTVVVIPNPTGTSAVIGAQKIQFFRIPEGGIIQGGTTTKTLRDTNLRTPGMLAQPQVFIATGMRVHVSPITGDCIATTPAGGDLSDMIQTFQAISEESVVSFALGTKTYLTVPTHMVPSNCGLDAFGLAAFNEDSAGTDPLEANSFHSMYLAGDYFSFLPNQRRIPPSHEISAAIEFPTATKNFIIGTGVKVTLLFDGLRGVEVS